MKSAAVLALTFAAVFSEAASGAAIDSSKIGAGSDFFTINFDEQGNGTVSI